MVFAPVLHMLGVIDIKPPATQYGYTLDYIYAVNDWNDDGTMGSNIARRRKWPQGLYIYARAFTEAEIIAQGIEDPLPHGVFIVHTGLEGENEFELMDSDMQATDWMIGTRA